MHQYTLNTELLKYLPKALNKHILKKPGKAYNVMKNSRKLTSHEKSRETTEVIKILEIRSNSNPDTIQSVVKEDNIFRLAKC